MSSEPPSFLIIGAGVFGVSTAYHLIKKYPNASVTLVDRDAYDAESRVAASWDWNKAVRADYDDIVYCQLALEAQDVFKSDPLWKPYFHETGVYWICRSDYAQDVINNYKKLGRTADLAAYPIEEARKMYGGLFEDADYSGAKEVLINKTSGWAAAGDCLRAVTRKAIELGVKYVAAEVSALQVDKNRHCSGIKTATGTILEASHVILCTGAYTPKLLEFSAATSGFAELRAGPRIVAGGITTGMWKVDDESYERFASMPVGFQGYNAESGAFIGSLPPTKDREMKWWGQTIFKNTREAKEDPLSRREAGLFKLSSVETVLLVSRCHEAAAWRPIGTPMMLLDDLSTLADDLQEERLAHLEEKLDILLSGSLASHATRQQEHAFEDVAEPSEKSYSATPPGPELNKPPGHARLPSVMPESDESSLRPSPSDIAVGIGLYFKYCHRQPIWCFSREDVSDYGTLPGELACSIMVLTSRFSEKRDQLQLYSDSAKHLVMLRLASGTVDLTTIESLCLLSYSSFIDGNFHLGQFHLGLAFQLCRTAMLDLESVYAVDDPNTERKKRLFWSLQLLEQFYGRQNGLLSVPTDIWRPYHSQSHSGDRGDLDPKAPPLPRDELGCADPDEPGIWNTSVHLAWVWSQVRKYVSNCAHNILKEPWRHDSMYAKVLSDFMEIENRIPICHRYDSAKFYKRKIEELKVNRDYWAPWLKEQFTYHAIHTVLNHPFLYIVGAQHNPNLAIPNTFWRRSSELALLHATWIARMIDMAVDKQVPLADPFFGHAAAIAATVHLYYCCAAAPRLKYKSNTDFVKCKRFLKRFVNCSAACKALDRNLDKMTRMAAGPDSMDMEDWMPSKIYLSVPLMWEILQFSFTDDSHEASTAGLLDASLTPPVTGDDMSESPTLEIIVATSPEISINTADGGQEAPTMSFKASSHSARDSPWSTYRDEDSLAFHFTPWLYADSSQFISMGDMGYYDTQPAMGESRGMAWWEGDNFSNIMFNHF
ncbi:fungal specific transcription factor [Purpureocillium lilacinum]|uniref:Fungal specific transcription factor n=1 Tax=Purpureocillium lilacinum TaxID=33203 RepID=A0A179GCU7_PURLI|nr:fungal specific transcription factor [Purpureocillium lilacinum]